MTQTYGTWPCTYPQHRRKAMTCYCQGLVLLIRGTFCFEMQALLLIILSYHMRGS